jgi:lipopolysaccharide/colanic/teichoic acid biosynthesis glycosyltransferase
MSPDVEFVLPTELPTELAVETAANPSRPLRLQLMLKRILDSACAFFLILLLSPVLVLIAISIRLSSSGPAFFRQKRWGSDETQFDCWKFRTMYVDQDSRVPAARVRELQEKGILFKPKNDPRVTPLGSFLRKASLDELPQLFNVLGGEMSFVGPRPLMLHMLAPYPELRRARGQMRPGITGLWQVSARESNETALQMARYDLAYIRGFSLWNDLRILLRTPGVVLFRKGAY